MEQLTSTRGLNLIFPIFLVLAPLLFLIFKQFTSSTTTKSLPPGPRSWPILGNLLQIGTKPHISLTHFAQLQGPLISLKLGTQLLVVGSSSAAAAEILKTHDALLSARSPPEVVTNLEGLDFKLLSLVWADCNDRWRFLRGLCKTELFSGKALETTAMIREKKVKEMVEFLGTKQGQVVKIAQVVSVTVYNSVTNLLFSKDFCHYGDDGPGKLKEVLSLAEQHVGYVGNIAEFYPVFARFDLQGLKKKGLVLTRQLYAVWEDVIKERRENPNLHSQEQHDFLDVLISKGFEDEKINYLIPEILSAGTDTTTTTVEWAMTELMKNKEAMRKLGEELKREIKKDSIKESDLPRLPYLLACVMETLRLHAPVPFLLPHRALETCQVMGYTIPKDTRVLVNVYAIGRDPAAWEDPLSFKPERFLDSKINFQGLDFEYIPFGSGRRMCPGQSLGIKQVLLLLAHLVHCFDWCLPNNEDPAHLDMNEELFLTLHKKQPLCLIPKKKVL